jgi:hypothetical protein
VIAWADFELEGFRWIGDAGEPSWYYSRPGSRRGFCANCGASMCALDDGTDSICVTLGSLDDPSSVTPTTHSFKKSGPRWLAVPTRDPA